MLVLSTLLKICADTTGVIHQSKTLQWAGVVLGFLGGSGIGSCYFLVVLVELWGCSRGFW